MRNLLRNLTVCIVLFTAPMAFADRQGGGGLLVTAGRVSIDKWLDFDARLVPVVVPDLNISDASGKPVSEFVRFKSAKGNQVTFDYTWIVGAQKGLAEVTLDKAKASEQSSDLIRALLDSKANADWEAIK